MTYLLNRWSGIGNVAADPQTGNMGDGSPWASFRIACDRPYDGDDGLDADFIPVVAKWDLAKQASRLIKKGRLIYVEGRISVRGSIDGSGPQIEIHAEFIRMLDEPPQGVSRLNKSQTRTENPRFEYFGSRDLSSEQGDSRTRRTGPIPANGGLPFRSPSHNV